MHGVCLRSVSCFGAEQAPAACLWGEQLVANVSLLAVGVFPAARHWSGGVRPVQPTPGRFRTDIQALRAVAVGLVVANHLWPAALPGGFVGVDVFFVISGFLISSHLFREIQASGRVRLAAFYSRRARRLFPAAFLVLGAAMLLAVLFLPYPRWGATAKEVLASVFYAENWLLAAKSVDYSAMTESASAVQHYWSLSVEEQFYLFWPLALVLISAVSRRMRSAPDRMLLVAVVLAAAVSFAVSIYMTQTRPEQAYFVTPVRVWEFAAGAVVALVGVSRMGRPVRNVLAVVGFAMIIASALTYGPETAFPGWTAVVPVAGTALVIAAGTGAGRLQHSRVTALPPVQFLGKISYSLYLWHWPLIVAAPFVLGEVPTGAHKFAILVLSLLLAWATKQWVEDRWIVRRGGRHQLVSGNGFRRPVAGMAVVAAVACLVAGAGQLKESQAIELAAAGAAGPCYGTAAVGNRDCGDPFAIPVAVPVMSDGNGYWHVPERCPKVPDRLLEGGGPSSCDFSSGDPDAETVWIAGDSHAQHWLATVLALAEERGWNVKWTTLGGCPLLDGVPLVSFNAGILDQVDRDKCARWSRLTVDAIESDRPAKVFVSMYAEQEVIDDGTGRGQDDQFEDGLMRVWQRWTDAGTTVFPIIDPPLNASVRDDDCIVRHAATPADCAVPREEAMAMNPVSRAAERMDSDMVRPLDFTDYFCDLHDCYAAVGGVAVYYDANHLNSTFARTMAPALGKELD